MTYNKNIQLVSNNKSLTIYRYEFYDIYQYTDKNYMTM